VKDSGSLNILLLDDNAHRITFFKNGLKAHKLTICSHARAAMKALKKTSFDVIFLDQDLREGHVDSEDENCGSEVARYIANHEIACSCIVLHTENDIGRAAMEGILTQCHSIPYGKLKKLGFHAVLKLANQVETAEDSSDS
jgi:CheY-like chemotaxis protein